MESGHWGCASSAQKMTNNIETRLAVCSWSLQPETPEALIAQLREIGLSRVQLALDPLRDNPDIWNKTPELFAAAGIEIVSGMFGTIGEDYTTLETIKETGGVLPDQHWESNWEGIQKISEIANELNLKLVTFHAGFLPHKESDPNFTKLMNRIELIAELFSDKNIDLGFETGQETADTLKIFLEKLNKPSVGVNFDPANMILYAKGDPIKALNTLSPFLKQCHIKDATTTKEPGTWGEEVVVGTGEVDWSAFFTALKILGFDGDCCIEREAGDQRIIDIRSASEFVGKL